MVLLLGALALISFAISLALLGLSRLLYARAGVPAHSRVAFCDPGAWSKVEDPLFSSRYGLIGKPDYVVSIEGDKSQTYASYQSRNHDQGDWGVPKRGLVIPLEVKQNRSAAAPRESDVMQLAACGLLVEQVWGVKPPYGLLKYRDAIFRVEFTSGLRARLLDVMAAMRRDLQSKDVQCSHQEPDRCLDCGYRSNCGQALRGGEVLSVIDPRSSHG